MDRALVFVGFMGAGKSSAAADVAAARGGPALDADTEIERRAGASIAELFASEGEAAFREREQETVLALLAGAADGPTHELLSCKPPYTWYGSSPSTLTW